MYPLHTGGIGMTLKKEGVAKVFDLETTTKSSFKRKANPFDKDNWIVAIGIKTVGVQDIKAIYNKSKESCIYTCYWFKSLLEGCRLLIGHNIKFDVLHAIQDKDNYSLWKQWVASGGRIWDTQLAEYLLQGMHPSSHYLSLDEVAPTYGGDLKVDEVKTLWEAGVDTPDIDKDLLLRYLIGDEDTLGDIGNTELIFNGQLKLARERGQLQSIMLNMDSLLFTIECEHNGMAIDLALGEKLAEELAKELAELDATLNSYLPKDLPFEFSFSSRKQLSALIFGGSVPYEERHPIFDEQGEAVYPLKTVEGVVIDGQEIAVRDLTIDQIANVPRYATGKNAGALKTKLIKVYDKDKPQKTKVVTLEYSFVGYTKPDPEWATKNEGVYSTSSEVIEVLGNRDIPFLKALSRRAAIVKDLGTYFITTDSDGNTKGMLSLVNDGVIHHSINHTSTVTGRFSSTNPNLQNIPKGKKSRIKEVFTSRYPEGTIIQSDFSSLEIYVQAILTKCQKLIEELEKGTDMHCLRLSVKMNVSYEEAYRMCKIVCDKVWDSWRTDAKVFSFQRAYGAGAKKISDSTGMPIEDVEALIEAEKILFPELEVYFEQVSIRIANSARSVGNIQPHPLFPAKMCDLRVGTSRTPDGKIYSYQEDFAPDFVVKRGGEFTTFSPTQIKNYEVQGTGAEFAKAAMGLAIKAFYCLNNFDEQAKLVNQVHDACYVDASNGTITLQAAALLHVCMEEASPYMEKLFNWKLPLYIPTDTTYGKSMADEDKFEPNEFKTTCEGYRAFVKSLY